MNTKLLAVAACLVASVAFASSPWGHYQPAVKLKANPTDMQPGQNATISATYANTAPCALGETGMVLRFYDLTVFSTNPKGRYGPVLAEVAAPYNTSALGTVVTTAFQGIPIPSGTTGDIFVGLYNECVFLVPNGFVDGTSGTIQGNMETILLYVGGQTLARRCRKGSCTYRTVY